MLSQLVIFSLLWINVPQVLLQGEYFCAGCSTSPCDPFYVPALMFSCSDVSCYDVLLFRRCFLLVWAPTLACSALICSCECIKCAHAYAPALVCCSGALLLCCAPAQDVFAHTLVLCRRCFLLVWAPTLACPALMCSCADVLMHKMCSCIMLMLWCAPAVLCSCCVVLLLRMYLLIL